MDSIDTKICPFQIAARRWQCWHRDNCDSCSKKTRFKFPPASACRSQFNLQRTSFWNFGQYGQAISPPRCLNGGGGRLAWRRADLHCSRYIAWIAFRFTDHRTGFVRTQTTNELRSRTSLPFFSGAPKVKGAASSHRRWYPCLAPYARTLRGCFGVDSLSRKSDN